MKHLRGKITYIAVLTLILAFCGMFVFACGDPYGKDRHVRVTLVDSDKFTVADGGARTAVTERYGSVEFLLDTQDNYYISEVDYEFYTLTPLGNNRVRLSIRRVASSVRINVVCLAEERAAVTYDANGGNYRNFDEPYTMKYSVGKHIRPNTETGVDSVYRDGHTLIGWNTAADGSGTHIGLGSRCDATKEEPLYLYAEWAEHTPLSDFEFGGAGDNMRITRYKGNAETVCVPNKTASGATVTNIFGGAFSHSTVKTVILPDTITSVSQYAFEGCLELKEMYFYDNIESISDDAFVDCPALSTVHINAALAPRYTALDRHANLADKFDILIKHKNDRKIVVWGGSGAYFSVDSSMIFDAFGGEYDVVNVAINGWFSTYVQSDIIREYIGDGDILLHIPEMSSTPQLFYNTVFAVANPQMTNGYDDRLFMALEENYDLLSLVDIRKTPGVFDSFNRYNADRVGKPAVDYSDYADFIDEYGDYSQPKPDYGKDISISNEADLRISALTERSNSARNEFYGEVKAKGATVFTAFAAVNRHALIARDITEQKDHISDAAEFESKFMLGIDNAVCIENIFDAIYDGSVFFNSDWHLGERATAANTEVLIQGMRSALKGARRQA